MYDNILKMARLIRQRPSISAREVARSLGYAEPKSVYYWLGKIGFTFVGFKDSVLSGLWPATSTGMEEGLLPYDRGVPIAEAFTDDGMPDIGSATAPFSWPGASFAYAWEGRRYVPFIAPGDWVVVGPSPKASGPTMLLLDSEHQTALARLIEEGERPLLVEISFERVWEAPRAAVVGRVAAVVRVP